MMPQKSFLSKSMQPSDMSNDQASADCWATDIIDMSPGVIRYRGYAVQDLIGNVGFAQMVWLMLRVIYLQARKPNFWRPR